MHKTQDPAVLQAQINRLQHAADVAALCVIDLRAQLQASENDFLAGIITQEEHKSRLIRFNALLGTLQRAGYTGTHRFLNIPKRPGEQGDDNG